MSELMLASPDTQDLTALKALGRAHLEANRMEDALHVYAGILRDHPKDADAYLFIGDCYLGDGDGETALLLYEQANRIKPDDPNINRRIQLAHLESQGQQMPADEHIPSEPQQVAGLLQELTGSPEPVTEAEVFEAADLLEMIVHNAEPAQAVAENLERIDALLPALLELNIRQARADGRPDLAQALQQLLINIQLQIKEQEAYAGNTSDLLSAVQFQPAPRVLFLNPSGGEISYRQTLPAEALANFGCEVTVASQFPPDFQERFDVVIAHQPHGDQKTVQGLAACAAAGLRIILDLDNDYEHLPITHPKYDAYGLGTPANVKAYTATLLLADRICVPSKTLAERLASSGYSARYIPDGWSRANALWDKPVPRRSTVNLGILSLPGQLEDIAMIRRIVIRTLREYSHTRLIVAGDLQAYQIFDSIPEARRVFLPPVNLEDYPYMLGQIDILLVPSRNTHFNQAASDRLLVEAGASGIPWVASPMPSVLDWGQGGLIANNLDEWYAVLRQLIREPETRAVLGRIGRQKAESREMSRMAGEWYTLVSEPFHSFPSQ